MWKTLLALVLMQNLIRKVGSLCVMLWSPPLSNILIFALHVMNVGNAVNVARKRGNFVDPNCHKQQEPATRALVCGGLKIVGSCSLAIDFRSAYVTQFSINTN